MAEWSIPLETICAKHKAQLADAVRALTLYAFGQVILRSPADTGRFRNNWNVSYGKIETTITDSVDASPGGGATHARVRSAVLSSPVGGIVYMTNSLPYARVIEFGEYPNPPKFGSKKRGEKVARIHVVNGFSEQAPRGVVRVSAQETIHNADRIVRGIRNRKKP